MTLQPNISEPPRTHAWEDALTDQDREVIKRGGYGRRRGLGRRPALVIIDCGHNHVGLDAPILEQQERYPQAGGAVAWAAVRRIAGLVEAARSADVPIVFTRYCVPEVLAQYDVFALKRGGAERFIPSAPGVQIVKELEPRPGDLVIDKTSASALFRTPLATYLVKLGVDSLIVTGVSTSGCVRATLVDAVSMGFNAAVVEDCVADRIIVSHKAALLDIWMKYGDVIWADEALEYLRQLGRARETVEGRWRGES